MNPHKKETPLAATGGASCNQHCGCLHQSFSLTEPTLQPIPPMIALHIGEAECARLVLNDWNRSALMISDEGRAAL
jgi:hypothetical protein